MKFVLRLRRSSEKSFFPRTVFVRPHPAKFPEIMGNISDIVESTPARILRRARPGPVRGLRAVATHTGKLVLEWKAPAGAAAQSYRVERTREGRDYELVLETEIPWCCIKDAPRKEPWFYRVTAINERGAGRAKLVYFFQRAGNGRSRLVPVPVLPGLKVVISELFRA
jgi:hypothetical protein